MSTEIEPEATDIEPIEGPGTEIARVMAEGDTRAMLAVLEDKAALAPRFSKALNTILVSQTYPEDWTEQGGKMCLSSAGAERVARLFDIRFSDARWRKEAFTDDFGAAYRYVYECQASWGNRTVFAQGTYSTRDKFLGFVNGEWRPITDINENNIRNAAYHICIGNGIKALLGLRGIPAERFREMMGAIGHDPGKASSVKRGTGTQGGTTTGDAAQQKELAEICIAIAQSGMTVAKGDDDKWHPAALSDADERPIIEQAKEICRAISSFVGKDGTVVPGKLASQLVGKRLGVTLRVAREIKEALDKELGNENG